MSAPVGHWSLYRCTISRDEPAIPRSELSFCALVSAESNALAVKISFDNMLYFVGKVILNLPD